MYFHVLLYLQFFFHGTPSEPLFFFFIIVVTVGLCSNVSCPNQKVSSLNVTFLLFGLPESLVQRFVAHCLSRVADNLHDVFFTTSQPV